MPKMIYTKEIQSIPVKKERALDRINRMGLALGPGCKVHGAAGRFRV